MSVIKCNCRCSCNCTLYAVIASVILGVITAFLLISDVIAISDTFLWVALGISVVYLAILLGFTGLRSDADACECKCPSLRALLVGILGVILFSAVLLALTADLVPIVAAVLYGILIGFLTLTLASSACLVKCLADCGD